VADEDDLLESEPTERSRLRFRFLGLPLNLGAAEQNRINILLVNN